MIKSYLKIRIKEILRILLGIGILRVVCLFLICMCGILFLVNTEKGILIFFLLCLGGYHSYRQDKYFLKCNFTDINAFFRKEYFIIGALFIVFELLHKHWLSVLGMISFTLLIPFSKKIQFYSRAIRLRFLCQCNLEYIIMVRKYWLIYVLLVLFSIMGLIHDNPRIIKVSMIIWGIIQSSAYNEKTSIYTIINYKNYNTLQRMLWKGSVLNSCISFTTFAFLLSFSIYDVKNFAFLASCIIAAILYLQGVALMSLVSENNFSFTIFRIVIFSVVFICSCLMPLFNGIFIIFIIIISCQIYNKYKALWNC